MRAGISGELPAAVLWDMDGTIVDTEPEWIAAEHALVADFGGAWSHTLAHQLVGQDLLYSAAFIRANSPVTLPPQEIVEELLARVVAAVRRKIPWRPGALDLLHALYDSGVPMALVTMSWASLAQAVLDALPEPFFAAVVSGDQVRSGKPDPEPYLLGARRLGLPPARCVAIEDSPAGVSSAVAAGIPTIAVPHVIPVPEMPGAIQVPSLVGLTPQDLARLAVQAVGS